MEKVDVVSLANSVANLFDHRQEEKIQVQSALQECFVLADKKQLLQVLNNVVLNAVQATAEVADQKIKLTITKNDLQVFISVSDNGKGIDDDIREKVFAPYFTTKGSGTGLGLAITKNMIEQMHGSITFESELNKGTTFIISLPAA